jgi:hypothetical protein
VVEDNSFVRATVDVIGCIVGDEPGYLPLLEHVQLAALRTVTGDPATPSRTNWAWDEVVLACDLVSRNGWKSLLRTTFKSQPFRRSCGGSPKPQHLWTSAASAV